jgi:hypothetical protein
MAEQISLPPRPPLTIEVGGESYKMSYGLEMDLRRLLPDPNSTVELIMADPFTQDYVLRRVLTKVNKIIMNPEDLIPYEEVELSPDEVDDVLKWAAAHAIYFFAKRTASLAQLGVEMSSALPKPSKDGSENSASTTPSAGPSESSKES